MRFLIHWLLVVFTVLNPMLANAALTDYDRQEFGFFNALKDKNAGLESGKANWTASGGSFTIGTATPIEGKQYGIFDASSAGQTLTSAAVTLHRTGTCEVSGFFRVPSGTSTYLLQAFDGTNVLASETVTNSATAIEHITEYPCQTSGTVAARLISVASNEPAIEHDGFKIGVARNVGATAQAVYKGSLLMTGCTDWSVSNTAFTSFTATAGCSYTATGDVLSPSTIIPGFRLQNVGPGRYLILARGYFGKSVTTTNADVSFRFTDGTNTFAERVAIAAASSSGQSIGVGEITGTIGYTTAQSTLTFQLQGQVSSTASSTAAVVSDDGGANATGEFGGLQFEVFYFPTATQTAIAADQQRPPKITRYTSGSGTHTTASGTTYMRVRAVGGGGGGGSSGTASWGAASAGGNTTFGTSLLTANGGSAGGQSGLANGGSATVAAPATQILAVNGQGGQGATYANPGSGNVATMGGNGGNTFFGGSGSGSSYGTAGSAASANTGGGGGGAGGSSTTVGFYSGSGGGAGGFVEAQIDAPASSYAYAVGAAGNGGTAGTSGLAGGNGAAGVIEVIEFFGYTTAMIANSVISRDAVSQQVTTVNTIVSKSTTYTATANEETISASMSGGAWTLSLPAAASVKGKRYYIILPDDSANGLTIDPNSTETICGQTTVVMRGLRDSMEIQSDGTNWVGLGESCWRTNTARLDCDSGSTIPVDRQRLVSSIGNISGGTCSVTLNTGNYSGAPTIVVSWNGTASSSDFYGVCSSATACAVGGGGGAVTSAQIDVITRGPR